MAEIGRFSSNDMATLSSGFSGCLMKKFTLSLLVGTAVLGFVSSTYAADLIIIEEPEVFEPIPVASGWDGAFIGIFAGGGWGR